MDATVFQSELEGRADRGDMNSPWTRMPTDVLGHMIDLEVAYYSLHCWLPYSSQNLREPCRLKTYVLVCRQWLTKCAPTLYKHVHLKGKSREEFTDFARCVSEGDSFFRQYASHVTFGLNQRAEAEWFMWELQQPLLPSNALGQWQRAHLTTIMVNTVKAASPEICLKITELTIQSCTLPSALHIISILDSLPRVTKVMLDDVEWWSSDMTQELFARRLGQYNRVTIDATGTTPLACLARLYEIPHMPDGEGPEWFSGLATADAMMMEGILDAWKPTTANGCRLIMRNSPHPFTWIISAIDRANVGSRQLEFHVTQDAGTVTEGNAQVRWVVFSFRGRTATTFEWFDTLSILQGLEPSFLGLSRLEKVVLENPDDGPVSGVNINEVAAALRSLRDKAFVWSRQDALEYAQHVNEGTARFAQLPISDPAAYELVAVVEPTGRIQDKIKLLVA